MLSETALERARRVLVGRPVRLALLEELWPLVKDFDFESGKILELQQPTHKLLEVAPIPKEGPRPTEIELTDTGKTVRYSHRAIRHTVGALGLSTGSKFSDGFLRIKKRRK